METTKTKIVSKEKKIWEIVQKILDNHGDFIDNISIHESSSIDNESIKIYHSDGFCWELEREKVCEPDEVKNFDDVDADGYVYSFQEPWEDFKQSRINTAISILLSY